MLTRLLAPHPHWAREPQLQPPYAFDDVYRAYAESVAKWAARLGGPRVDYEDVVQEVFLTVQRELPRYRGTAPLTTWLYRITLNQVRYRLRKNRFRRWLSGLAPDWATDVPAPGHNALDTLEHREAVDALYAALYGLKERHRQVLVLFEMEERSGAEVAELMGARVETVWVWLHRARAELAKRLRLDGEGR